MIEVYLFISTFSLVFLLGLQSLNVQGGHYYAAFCTSLGIGICNMVMYKMAPSATPFQVGVVIVAGPLGIISSMYFHRNIRKNLTFWK